jgi:D-alanyl-D-alanine carboxypeptidase (penicillin-binding protein 5/6)
VAQHEPHDGLDELWARFPSAQEPAQATAPIETPETPAPRRRRWIRRLIPIVAIVAVLAVIGTYVGLTLSAPVGAASAALTKPNVARPAAATLVLPQVGESAVSVSGADDYLGPSADGVFASSGGNGALPMASISKLITAMVIVNAKPLGASGNGSTIAWTKDDTALYDKYFVLNATIAPMKAGSSMTEHDAIETMLVISACNYAEAMATWAFGSDAGFVSAARKWLKANGLTGTTMVEPTGLDDRNTSTPSDLIAIGKLAMANPAIAAMVAMTSPDVPGLEGFANTNDLLGSDGVNGVKTGTLDSAGSDLLFSAVVPVNAGVTLDLVGVVLGGQSRGSVDAGVRALIDSIKAGFHDVDLGDQGEVVGSYSTAWGARASMVLDKSASVYTWSNSAITATMTTTALKSGTDGEKVGTVTWVSGKTRVTVPVVLQGSIRGPSAWWRLTHPTELLGR